MLHPGLNFRGKNAILGSPHTKRHPMPNMQDSQYLTGRLLLLDRLRRVRYVDLNANRRSSLQKLGTLKGTNSIFG